MEYEAKQAVSSKYPSLRKHNTLDMINPCDEIQYYYYQM